MNYFNATTRVLSTLTIMFTAMNSSVSSFVPVISRASRASTGLTRRRVPASMSRSNQTLSSTMTKEPNIETFVDQQETNRADDNSKILGKFPHGHTVVNKGEIFDEVDKALGVSKPPDVEVILTDHMANLNNSFSKFMHLNVMRFGHIAVKYRTSDGQQHVMNIMGNFNDPDSTLINFFDPAEYFYGTDPKIAQQGGVYSRPFVGVRIENVAPGATDAMHAYYQAVAKASEIGSVEQGDHSADGTTPHDVSGAPGSSKRGAARFQLVEVQFSRLARTLPAPLDKILYKAADWIRERDDKRKQMAKEATEKVESFVKEQDDRFMDGKMTEMMEKTSYNMMDVRRSLYQAGNCAQWTSGGLEFAGLMRRARLFPKAILVDLLEDEYLTNRQPNNVNVVYYAEVEEAPKIYEGFKCIKSAMVSPLKPIRNKFYLNMEEFAGAVVEVPPGTDRAVVKAQDPTKAPEKWLQYLSLATIYVPAAVMVGLVDQIGPLGPTVAAGWLAANWWLY